jgi:hypothetical protein
LHAAIRELDLERRLRLTRVAKEVFVDSLVGGVSLHAAIRELDLERRLRLTRVAKEVFVDSLVGGMVDGNAVVKFVAALNAAQEGTRKTRSGMRRCGDERDDDPNAIKDCLYQNK